MIFGSSMQESRTSTGPVLGDLPRVDSSQTTSCGSDLNAERSVLKPTFLLSDSNFIARAIAGALHRTDVTRAVAGRAVTGDRRPVSGDAATVVSGLCVYHTQHDHTLNFPSPNQL
jgi:hypothetical protein